ncbi:MAG: hypothetical protein WC547_05895 [Candidatus Omnitrophota bacterium]
MIKRFYPGLFLVFSIFLSATDPAAALGESAPVKEKLVFFFSQNCHSCHEVKEGILSLVSHDYQDRIEIEYRDIADIENYRMLLGIRAKLNLPAQVQTPSVYFADQLLIGKDKVESTLLQLVRQPLAGAPAPVSVPSDRMPAIDIVEHFRSFTPVAVIGAGLIDGINPCAFTVIVFFMSFLALQGYRRKELTIIGLSFIFAVFLTYLLLGLGLFNFFYSLKALWVVRKILNIGIGLFTMVLGIFAVRDIVRFKKTGSTEGMALQLPGAVKDQIHNIIGLSYRRADSTQGPVAKKHLFTVIVTTFVTGFLVSLLEAVCTGQVYLPTITFVLKTTQVRLQAAGYLVLYNVMFVVPLVVIFSCALAGTTSGEFTKILRRHFLLIKSLLAGVFFAFGILLIWRG